MNQVTHVRQQTELEGGDPIQLETEGYKCRAALALPGSAAITGDHIHTHFRSPRPAEKVLFP